MSGVSAIAVPSANMFGAATPAQELFALTDEQILEIEPHLPDATPVAQPILAVRDVRLATTQTAQTGLSARHDSSEGAAPKPDRGSRFTDHAAPVAQPILPARDVWPATTQTAQTGLSALPEPPPWLAAQMKDPWSGDEARELWDGVQQARNEAAAYREVFAKPEDARASADESRALKELYPGGVTQARTTAERARALEEIDAAFFGGAGKSAEEITAGRAALAQRMLREDPAAFREMVFAGLRALEEPNPAPPFRAASAAPESSGESQRPALPPEQSPNSSRQSPVTSHDAQLAAYRNFEKSANDDLERSVGAAIHRTLEQALPVAQTILSAPGETRIGASASGAPQLAQARLPALRDRLGAAIRDDVESALKSDPQLGEQISQMLAARRFDDTTRAQVVRLINDRAQQLVPAAARRVIQDWTQTAFAAHRGNGANVVQGFSAASADDTVFAGKTTNVAPERSLAADSSSLTRSANRASASAISAKTAAADRAEHDTGLRPRVAARTNGRAVDYGRLTDEQILEM